MAMTTPGGYNETVKAVPPSEATCPIRVLLIEDNPTDIVVLRQVLAGGRAAGSFTLTTAATLTAGLGALANEPIDVVLLDLGLPDSWGIATFTSVAAQAGTVYGP